jgi:AcrR family transcriptional regulator
MTVTEKPRPEASPPRPEAAPARPEATPNVRERILDVAQALFAEQGYAATSTRAIAQAAGVNLAQLHYHYGAKRDLFKAAYLRGAGQVTEARAKALAGLKAAHGAAPIPLEALVESFVTPFMLNGQTPEGRATMQMHARLHTEPDDIAKEVLSTVYDDTTLAYLAEFQRVLPGVEHEVLCWRIYFMMGAYRYTLLRTGRLEMMSGGACDSGDFDRAVAEIVPFLCAGLRAG